MTQGSPTKVIGLEPSTVCEEIQIIDGIVIEPSTACYNEEEELSRAEEAKMLDTKTEVKMED